MVGLIAFVAVKPGVAAAESSIKLDLKCIEKHLSNGQSSLDMVSDCERANGHSKIMKGLVGKFLPVRPLVSPVRNGVSRRSNVPMMSHLTHVKTQLKDPDSLKGALEDMGLPLKVQVD